MYGISARCGKLRTSLIYPGRRGVFANRLDGDFRRFRRRGDNRHSWKQLLGRGMQRTFRCVLEHRHRESSLRHRGHRSREDVDCADWCRLQRVPQLGDMKRRCRRCGTVSRYRRLNVHQWHGSLQNHRDGSGYAQRLPERGGSVW